MMIFSKLKVRLTVTTFLLLAIASVFMVLAVNYFQKQYALAVAEKKSLILLQHNLAIHSYFNNQLKPKLFSLTDAVRDAEFFDAAWMSSTYAVREIEKIYDEKSGHRYYYKEAAINARSPLNEADDFERDFIQRLNKDQSLNKISGVRDFDGKPYYYILMRGESMEQGCMRCHSEPDKAPGGMVKAYGATRSFNRSVGEQVSAVSIHIPLTEAYSDVDKFSLKLSTVLLSLLLVVFIIQNRLVSRLILTPLQNIRSQAESISNDVENLGVAIPEVFTQEMNEIAGSFNIMSRRLKGFVDGLDHTVHERTAALQESEAKYRLLFENMTNSFALHEIIFDASGKPSDYRFIEVNPAFEAQTGLKASEVIGRTVLEILPNTEKFWIETYGKVAVTGEPASFENFSQELEHYYQVWAYCPKPGFFATVFTDITERKFKESASLKTGHLIQLASAHTDLHECISALTDFIQGWSGCEAVGIRLRAGDDFPYFETRGFPAAFVHAENTLCAYGPDGGILRDGEGNPVLECMCGNILYGRFDAAKPFFTPRGSFWTNCTTELLAGTSEADRQARTRNRCNGEGYESVALIPIHAGDQIIGLIQLNDHRRDRFTPAHIEAFEGMADKIAVALTRRQAETEVSRVEKLHHDMLNSIPDLIWLKDKEGLYLSCNEAFERFIGAGEADIIGRTDYDFIGKEQADLFRENDLKVIATGKICNNEEWITFADDGHRALLFTTKSPIYGVDGNLVGILGVSRDISGIKQAEEEKLALTSQLHQAQKMESVGSLAGGVAHDFNNKLSVILGCTYMAFNETDQVKLQNFLEEIRKAAEQSADLTRQLLAFARKQTISPKVLDLNETVAGMIKMLQRLIGEDVRLAWHPAPDLWLLKLDPSQIDQILANLCVNARDSISVDGKITIETGNSTIDEVYCAHESSAVPGEYVRLAVSDNGCGMDKETQDRIFEPFFTTKDTGKGTGLGLATVFGIVKQNNGFINVYSEPGVGTTFSIYLPRHAGTPVLTDKAGATMPAPRGLETILLVEDELSILNMTSMILAKQGYSVLQANSPAEAIRLAKEHDGEISLLITDVIMPEMNGKDLADNLKSFNSQLKCLFMSGYTADAISRHGVLEEGVNFIEKPFSLPDLATMVREILDGKPLE